MNSTVAQQTAGESVGFGERLVAYIIDAVILGVVFGILSVVLPLGLYYLLSIIGGLAYTIGFWTTSGQTPGKKVMKLQVVDAATDQVLQPGQAVLRYVGYIVSSIPLGLGFLWVIWDEKHEGWHDKIAKTKVVRVQQ